MEIDVQKLSDHLGVPVIPIVATKGTNVSKLIEITQTIKTKSKPLEIIYRKDIESTIKELTIDINKLNLKYPSRWVAIKLLEEEENITKLIIKQNPNLIGKTNLIIKKTKKKYGQSPAITIASERYSISEIISRSCITLTKKSIPFTQKLDDFLLHRYFGYGFLALVASIIFYSIFSLGGILSAYLMELLLTIKAIITQYVGNGLLSELFLGGVLDGIIAGISIALPYLIPFYIVLAILEDSGYLARMAFLMDAVMHKIGLHGKAFIPILLAYGCNVPGCISCKILETQRSRLLAAFVVTLVPCAAVTVVIMGLVARFVGLEWALFLYLLNILVIFVLGKFALKLLPGESVGLIMEMPSYKLPTIKNIIIETWREIKSFAYMAFPIIILSTFLIKLAELLGWLSTISDLLSPITVDWLGLPAIVGITLIFGILRKELALIMLATLLGTESFDLVLTPVQMITFAVVTMFYVPCASTIAALNKEFGWKKTLTISLFEIVFAILLAGIIARILDAFVF